ncbi:hypothetical protein PR202_gb15771 [Eleusine coracana subsp. coracana]|uniref:Uncharacterized protein n=1 Tax=Eleusine coracana subsp. coracana TaxID=191504 RepID=A0AAV5EYI0_ELECO|nr:hypothetical protein PR202_gb15771 [Eleusine coracana subsp. coracana]
MSSPPAPVTEVLVPSASAPATEAPVSFPPAEMWAPLPNLPCHHGGASAPRHRLSPLLSLPRVVRWHSGWDGTWVPRHIGGYRSSLPPYLRSIWRKLESREP